MAVAVSLCILLSLKRPNYDAPCGSSLVAFNFLHSLCAGSGYMIISRLLGLI